MDNKFQIIFQLCHYVQFRIELDRFLPNWIEEFIYIRSELKFFGQIGLGYLPTSTQIGLVKLE